MPVRRATVTHRTHALLVRRTDFGDSDLVLALFTEQLGNVSVHARAARKSRKRFGGTLEPFHTLNIIVDEQDDREMLTLKESQIERPRIRLSANLDAMQAAGRALAWVRTAVPVRTPERELWNTITRLLDQLDEPELQQPHLHLAEAGLAVLTTLGWGLELQNCVRTGLPCPPNKPAMLDPLRGGLISRQAGGAPLTISAEFRARLAAAQAGARDALLPEDAQLALEIVQQTLSAHTGLRQR